MLTEEMCRILTVMAGEDTAINFFDDRAMWSKVGLQEIHPSPNLDDARILQEKNFIQNYEEFSCLTEKGIVELGKLLGL